MHPLDIQKLLHILIDDKEKVFDILSDFKLVMVRIDDSVYRLTRECVVDKEYKYIEGESDAKQN